MANALYPNGLEALLNGDIDLLSDTIQVVLIDTGTASYNSAHDFYNDISAAAVWTPVALSSKTTTLGVFDSADPTWTGVSGSTVEAIAMIKWTGSAATSPLIGWWDTLPSGLPLTPNGGDVTYTVHSSGWFAL